MSPVCYYNYHNYYLQFETTTNRNVSNYFCFEGLTDKTFFEVNQMFQRLFGNNNNVLLTEIYNETPQ